LDELGEEREEQFEAVLLAQGHHAKPKMAQFPGQHQFQGRILHSHDFKDSRDFDEQATILGGILMVFHMFLPFCR
jgi:trimethylamine monooxygenase